MDALLEGLNVGAERLSLESRLGYPASFLEQDGVLWVATQQFAKENTDGHTVFVSECEPVTPQEHALALFQRARVVRHYNPYDPLQWRIEKWLLYDMGAPTFMPDGAKLIHQFRHGEGLYQAGSDFFITFTDINRVTTFHKVAVADVTVKQGQSDLLAQAVQAAIQADVEYRAAQNAEQELRLLLKLELNVSIKW